jgi:hypothetical protein
MSTTTEKLDILRDEIKRFLSTNTHQFSRFELCFDALTTSGFESLAQGKSTFVDKGLLMANDRMHVKVWVEHRCNFQDMKAFRRRHSEIVLKLKEICDSLDIIWVEKSKLETTTSEYLQ